MKVIDTITLILVIVGALNWGSIGLFGFDCVAFLCGGQMAVLSRVIYSLVGIAGLCALRCCSGRRTRPRRKNGQKREGRRGVPACLCTGVPSAAYFLPAAAKSMQKTPPKPAV